MNIKKLLLWIIVIVIVIIVLYFVLTYLTGYNMSANKTITASNMNNEIINLGTYTGETYKGYGLFVNGTYPYLAYCKKNNIVVPSNDSMSIVKQIIDLDKTATGKC